MIDEQDNGGAAVSNTDFLGALAEAAPDGTFLWTTHFIGDPSAASPWGGQVYGPQQHHDRIADSWGRFNCYFGVAALRPDSDGVVRRRKANFSRLLALVADDADADGLVGSASWILDTSPGKRQIGILLDEQDPDCADERLVTGLVNVMAKRGQIGGDLSGNNITRYVRLPVGQNQKPRPSGPWTHRLALWAPGHRLTLDDAAATFGIDLNDVRIELANPVTSAAAIDVGGEQEDRLRDSVSKIMAGVALHESINRMAASLISSGAKGGAVVNTLRALMESSAAPKDGRWQDRYNDIPRAVSTAEEKFKRPEVAPRPGVVIDLDGVITEVKPVKPPIFSRVSDLIDGLKPIEWLIDGYLETDALSMVFGPSGGGKSFCVVDMACCIATGKSWHGVGVKRGAVFYIAGEGHNGLARRFAAWQKYNGVKLDKTVELYKSNKSVLMLDRASAVEMSDEVQSIVDATGAPPALVVIDTLARNFGDGDENKQQDASMFIEHLDEFIRRRWNCNVMVVHHSGHDMDRARGSSALKGAMDQEVWVKGGGGRIEMTMTKMKDAEIPAPRCFKICQVDLGVSGPDGVEINGAYIELDGNPLDVKVGSRQGGGDITAMDVARAMTPEWSNSPAMAVRLHCSERSLTRIMSAMKGAGLATQRSGAKGWDLSPGALDALSMTGGLLG